METTVYNQMLSNVSEYEEIYTNEIMYKVNHIDQETEKTFYKIDDGLVNPVDEQSHKIFLDTIGRTEEAKMLNRSIMSKSEEIKQKIGCIRSYSETVKSALATLQNLVNQVSSDDMILEVMIRDLSEKMKDIESRKEYLYRYVNHQL